MPTPKKSFSQRQSNLSKYTAFKSVIKGHTTGGQAYSASDLSSLYQALNKKYVDPVTGKKAAESYLDLAYNVATSSEKGKFYDSKSTQFQKTYTNFLFQNQSTNTVKKDAAEALYGVDSATERLAEMDKAKEAWYATMKGEYGAKGITLDPFESTYDRQPTLDENRQRVFNETSSSQNVNTSKQGSYIPGLGVVGAGGVLTKGTTRNVGGGLLDTEIKSGPDGDYVAKGPRSVEVATKTLRSKFVLAGQQTLQATYETKGPISDTQFEAFSWVPAGYGNGPMNALHLQNVQNDQLRFGMEPLYQPRPESHRDLPFGTFPRDIEHRDLDQLAYDFNTIISEREAMDDTQDLLYQKPIVVLDDDYNNIPSSKRLPRNVGKLGSIYLPVDNNYTGFRSPNDPPTFLQQNTFQDSSASTLRIV